MTSTTKTPIAYTTTGPVRGDCGRIYETVDAAAASIEADHAGCVKQGGYSDRKIRPLYLDDCLSMQRVPWSIIRAAGYDLVEIAADARVHGDEALYRKAMRAADRDQEQREKNDA